MHLSIFLIRMWGAHMHPITTCTIGRGCWHVAAQALIERQTVAFEALQAFLDNPTPDPTLFNSLACG